MVASCRRPGSDARTGFVPTAPAGRGDGTPPAGKEGGALSGYHSAVAIPALNPSETLPAYVDDLLERGIPAVVVVNDGSAPDRQEIFDAQARRKGCVVLVHETNQGKGQAIKTACLCAGRGELPGAAGRGHRGRGRPARGGGCVRHRHPAGPGGKRGWSWAPGTCGRTTCPPGPKSGTG